jgi:hypothetical protein
MESLGVVPHDGGDGGADQADGRAEGHEDSPDGRRCKHAPSVGGSSEIL